MHVFFFFDLFSLELAQKQHNEEEIFATLLSLKTLQAHNIALFYIIQQKIENKNTPPEIKANI